MEIKWYGQSCFRIKGKNTVLVFDPYTPGSTGYSMNNVSADAIAVSHDDPTANYDEKIEGSRKTINGPGEYEIGDAIIIGIDTARDVASGTLRGRNTIFCAEIDEITVCHLGDLGHDLSSEQLDELGQIDVLMLPIGGSLGIKSAIALVNKLQPLLVLPMHYGSEQNGYRYTPVKDFLKEYGAENTIPQAKINITKNSMPLSMQIVILEA